ncbi:MAG TPA: SDR family oxidoreductase [Porticoccaceae bacterium]|nr:SDR family oxidoreductase [Porticoccaceae bacterium]
MELSGKTALVTGASGGIGAALARALAGAGAELVLTGRDGARLAALHRELDAPHRMVAADLTTPAGRATVIDACTALPGGLDILVNNAGVGAFGLLEDADPDAIERLLAVNLTAPILLTHGLLPLLHRAENAAVVNIGSAFGALGYPGFSAYCAGKFGLRGFSEALARELADSKVRILYLAPRATATAMNDSRVDALNAALGNAVDPPEAVASALLHLLRGRSRRRSLGRLEALFARLNALLPGVLDAGLARQLPLIRRCARS